MKTSESTKRRNWIFKFSNWSTKAKVLVATAAPLVLTLGIGIVAQMNLAKMAETSGWVEHTQKVLKQGDTIVASAVDMETGMRGYLLAGEETFLAPYHSGETNVYSSLDSLRTTVSDNPPQVERLAEAENILREWQSEVAEQQIAMRRAIGNSQTMVDLARKVQKAEGKQYFDRFRALAAEFIEVEEKLLEQRTSEFYKLLDRGETTGATIRNAMGMVNHTHEVIEQALSIVGAAVDMETGMRGFLLAGKEEFLEPYEAGGQAIESLIQNLAETVSDNPPQVERLHEIQTVIAEWRAKIVVPMLDLRREIGNAETMDDMARLVGEERGKHFFDQFRSIMSEFASIEQTLMQERRQANVETSSNTRFLILGAVAAAVLIGAAVSLIIGSSIGNAVRAVTQSMGRLAEGDTAVEITGQSRGDEVGAMARSLNVFRNSLVREKELEEAQRARDAQQAEVVRELSGRLSDLSRGDLTANISQSFPEDYEQLRKDFNTTAATLSQTVSQVISASSSIRNGAAEISQSSDDLSNRTESQAATLEETAAALDELTASVKSAAEGARSVESIMGEARAEAENSGIIVKDAVSAMTEIEQSSAKISQIIGVIDDIAFQTNLLALNAGVEAARAGEAGRGFAVVASEVRGLAQRSADAATEIKTLINDGSKQVTHGVELVGKAGGALNNIVERVNHISQLVSDIAEGAAEQSTGLGEINTGVVQLDKVTQQNAAMVEQSTAAGHMLSGDATKLAELVARFKIREEGFANTPYDRQAAEATLGGNEWQSTEHAPSIATASVDGNAAKDMWQEF
ncbi:Aspartate chemoreceptor protein [Leisingera aquaemixtae]|uniref:Aspartate chemoreceptor protein n=1 Tax=Leisingera aquaemixtae TaxID=1396826 RepID=A0A0P1H867_9RHOB|nr:methyl-accepting chemotaxis protein [Leisingera aquaemixtae]CUH99345.1 Aspartate chemoreceptor protein [Leisingera aquaemixtae]